jgi:hypothetical protein
MRRKPTRSDRVLALRDAVLRLANTRDFAIGLPDGTQLHGIIETPFTKTPKVEAPPGPTMWAATFRLPDGSTITGMIPALFPVGGTPKKKAGKKEPAWDYCLDVWDDKGKILSAHWHDPILGRPQDIEIVAFKRGPWEEALLAAEATTPAAPRPVDITLRTLRAMG